jgi:ligand-binding sensor domain-containing protein/DNA-binding CsgD family transcriptional regulator
MKKLLLLLLIPFNLLAQNTIGLPDAINYDKQEYNAGLQNWDIRQDKNGIIYVANNEGLLTFDGRYWNLFPLPNKTIVRSIEIGSDNKIYVGGQDELGYFSPTENGRLSYHSLIPLINKQNKSFGDVWDIVRINQNIFFRTPTKIFKLINGKIATYKASREWTFMGASRGVLYAHDYNSGLLKFENDTWIPILRQEELPKNDPITSIVPVRENQSIITTLKNGLFLLSDEGLTKVKTFNQKLFENERIYAATSINKNWLALATSNGGVYIIDWQGNIIQRFSKVEGLQNNNVLSIFLDQQQNLWLGLDNGIDFIAYDSPIKQINPILQDGSGYAALIFDNQLFLGTSNGLYSVALGNSKDLSFNKGNFRVIENSKGQTWGLSRINKDLLLGHHEGAFLIKNNKTVQISDLRGYWNFLPLSGAFGKAQMVAGTYDGLVLFNNINEKFVPEQKIPAFTESSRFIAMDNEGFLWVSHPYHGVYKISQSGSAKFSINTYTQKNGLPSNVNNHVYKIKNEVLVATEKGVYTYNKVKKSFEPSSYYQKLLGDKSLRYMKEDGSGNIWFIREKTLGVIDFTGEKPKIIYLPELNNKMLSGFEFIYPINQNNIFIGGEKGFFNVNFEKYKQTIPKLKVQVRTVRINNQTDSLLFGGFYNTVQKDQAIPDISNNWKTIQIEFSSPLFGFQSNIEYSYRLKEFDKTWSEWTKRTEKEYTNLPAGDYAFEVKARNNLGNESEVSSYSFHVLPPWYQTFIAKIFYLCLIVSSIIGLYKLQERKLELQQEKHQKEQAKLSYIHELELSKTEGELALLRNEKLEVEINLMNSELASSAMHLVKKAELLTKTKEELNKVIKVIDHPQAISELKKMMKTYNQDDKMDQEWKNFTKHFDKVHSDFLNIIKVKHPSISSNELKLCAYLRMNLSTKEIAQFANISVRGVEIGRYRLRKKLQIPTETNLFDYLIGIG